MFTIVCYTDSDRTFCAIPKREERKTEKEKNRMEVHMVLNVHRNHKAYYGRGEGGSGGGGRGRLYTYRYTVTTRMTSALGWAAVRAILVIQ